MTSKSMELRALAQRITDALPTDVELLVVTPGEPDLDECEGLALLES